MILATAAGGVLMSAVHPVTAKIDEYATFAVLLRCLVALGIPTAGLQIVFAQQAAAAIDELHLEQLRRTARAVMGGLFVGWLLLAVVVFQTQNSILALLNIKNANALWMTLLVVLVSLWLPVLRGILQGHQNFMALGWTAILDGAFRLGSVSVIVLLLHGQAAGAMGSAALGQFAVLLACLWWSRDIFKGSGFIVSMAGLVSAFNPADLGIGHAPLRPDRGHDLRQKRFSSERCGIIYSGGVGRVCLGAVHRTAGFRDVPENCPERGAHGNYRRAQIDVCNHGRRGLSGGIGLHSGPSVAPAHSLFHKPGLLEIRPAGPVVCLVHGLRHARQRADRKSPRTPAIRHRALVGRGFGGLRVDPFSAERLFENVAGAGGL